MFNPDCAICMNWCDCPWITVILAYKYFTTNFVIIIYSWNVFTFSVKISLALPVVSNFVPVSFKGDVKQHILSKYCCTWGGFKYHMVGGAMAQATLVRNVTMSLGATELAISISAVRSIIILTWCTCSSITFAWGFLTLVGLCLMPYESHRTLKWSLNSVDNVLTMRISTKPGSIN